MTANIPSTPRRLCQASLGDARPGVATPAYDRAATRVGVMHFGPGAFHRGHQAYYFDRLLAKDARWAIRAVSPRSAGLREALAAQDWLYTLAELDVETRFRVIGALKAVLVASETPEAVFAGLVAPELRLVTMTVTEKGYCLDAAGELDLDHADIQRDLAGPSAPVSLIGWLTEGLSRRRAAGLAPFISISCDKIAGNGRLLARAVTSFARARGEADLAAWIAGEARFASTMVDSITPATDAALKARVAREIGLVDAWPVQRERFVQWVVEDVLGPGAPDLASVGVTLTADVAGYERAKLRLLNGAHSTLAYLGGLRGYDTVGRAMADPALANFVRTLMTEDIAPSLRPPAGMVVGDYIAAILARFSNPEIRHLLSQIAADGSLKLPIRLLGAVEAALAADRPVERLAAPIAAWMRGIVAAARAGGSLADPLAGQLLGIGAACQDRGEVDVPAFLAVERVFQPSLASEARFRRALVAAYDDLVQGGPERLLARLAGGSAFGGS